ncbi:hypothetical protein C7G64_19105, partial [Acinetobacter baumannii]
KEKVASELPGRSNIHVFAADLTNYEDFKTAAEQTSAVTGGAVDYLVANAASVSSNEEYNPLGDLPVLTAAESLRNSVEVNVIGNMYFISAFLPLILKGKVKKIISLSTGMADIDLINGYDIEISAMYAASKAALNVIIAKYNVQYKKQGVLFLSYSPGVVDTGNFDASTLTPEQLQRLQTMFGGFAKYAPNFAGPVPTEVAVKQAVEVWENASLEKGDGG